jgi:hypothetical protein
MFARHGAPANVAATETTIPVDQVDGFIRSRLRFSDSFADCRDAQNAPTDRDDVTVSTLDFFF